MDRSEIMATIRSLLGGHAPELVAAYVFGSFARGEESADSDVDLAVLLREEPDGTLNSLRFDLAFELEPKIKRPVDVVVLNRAPTDLVHRVLRDGALVLESDRKARVAFEVRARAQYFDLAPLRRAYRAGGSRAQRSRP